MQTTHKEGKQKSPLNHERSFLSRTAIYHAHVRLVLSKYLPNYMHDQVEVSRIQTTC